jgi:general secretion pathway protein K
MSSRDPRSGIILVTVLWTIALISALAMAASTTFRGFAGIVALDRDRARADALLHAGLELSGGLIAKLDDKHPLTERETSISLSTGMVRIHLSDEGGRIDVNKAPVKVLAALLKSAGAGKDANVIAQSIDAWRVKDAADQSGGPPKLPNAPPPPNPPATQPNGSAPQANAAQPDDSFRSFTDLRQLAQIPGMEPDILAAIMPLTTVFGSDKVNALTASEDVLASLPDINPAQLSAFLAARRQSPLAGDRLLQMLGAAKDGVTAQERPVAAVFLSARLIDGYTAAAKAVIVVVPHDKQPYRILSWTALAASARSSLLADRF